MIPSWLPLFIIYEEERQKKLNDPDYNSPYDIDITEFSGWDILMGMLIGASPFIIAFTIIFIERWINK